MRINIVKEILKKEIRDILRDKKTLFMMIILPILLIPILMIGFSLVMSMSQNKVEQTKAIVAFDESVDKKIIKYFKEHEDIIQIIESSNTEYKQQIEEEILDIYISSNVVNDTKNYKIYANISDNNNIEAQSKVIDIIEEYKEEVVEENILNEGLDADYIMNPIRYETIDLAKGEETIGYVLGMVLPFIIMMAITMGATYPAIDIMAGEKERGTLETLLTLPISNLELIMGKYISVSVMAIATVIFYIGSLALTGISVLLMSDIGISSFDISSILGPILITIVCIVLFTMVVSAISMCLCSFAKSFKEAQNYMTPISLVVIIMSYVTMVPTIELDTFTAMIPGVNIPLLIKSVLTFDIDISLISIVLVTNIAFVILSVGLLAKIFNSEEILFGDGSGFSILEKRSDIKKGTLPKVSDGILLFAVSLVALVYIGGYLQMNFGMVGLMLSQLIFLILPLGFSYYIKTDFKKVFRLKIPKIKHILASIILWIGATLIITTINYILLSLFPSNTEVLKALNEALFMENSLFMNIIIVAIFPAICEEASFRGFIMSSFENKKKTGLSAVVFSSILFGLMHMDFIRMIPTALIGAMAGYATYKSGSILLGSLIHFINNSVSVLSMHMTSNTQVVETAISTSSLMIFVIVGSILVFISTLLFKEKSDKMHKKASQAR